MRLPFFSRNRKIKQLQFANLTITIVNNTRLDSFVPIFEKAIESLVKGDKRLKSFDWLIFILEDGGKYDGRGSKEIMADFLQKWWRRGGRLLSVVNPGDVVKTKSGDFSFARGTVHVLVDVLASSVLSRNTPFMPEKEQPPILSANEAIAYMWHDLRDVFFPIFTHEITHALHGLTGLYKERTKRVEAKKALIERRLLTNVVGLAEPVSYAKLLYKLREVIEALILKIWAEGLARYYESVLSNKTFLLSKSETFADLYKKAYNNLNSFLENLKYLTSNLAPDVVVDPIRKKRFLENVNMMNNLVGRLYYDIGLHMVFTIESTFHLEEKLLSIGLGEFIKLYEKACAQRSIQPLISLSSNKGLFDYKEMLRTLYRLEHKR